MKRFYVISILKEKKSNIHRGSPTRIQHEFAHELSKFVPTTAKVKNGRTNWLTKFREFHLPRPSFRPCRRISLPVKWQRNYFAPLWTRCPEQTSYSVKPTKFSVRRAAGEEIPSETIVPADELAEKLERENKLGQWQRKLSTMSRKRGGNSAKRRDSKADNNELHFPSRSVRLISAANEKSLHHLGGRSSLRSENRKICS